MVGVRCRLMCRSLAKKPAQPALKLNRSCSLCRKKTAILTLKLLNVTSMSSAARSKMRFMKNGSWNSISVLSHHNPSSTKACSWPNRSRPSILIFWMNGLCLALRFITSAIPPIHSRHGSWLNLSVFLLIMVKLTRFAATVTGCSVMKTVWHHHFSVTTSSISSLSLKMARLTQPPLIACLNLCFMLAVTCRWLKPCLFQKLSLQTHRKTCVTYTVIATR